MWIPHLSVRASSPIIFIQQDAIYAVISYLSASRLLTLRHHTWIQILSTFMLTLMLTVNRSITLHCTHIWWFHWCSLWIDFHSSHSVSVHTESNCFQSWNIFNFKPSKWLLENSGHFSIGTFDQCPTLGTSFMSWVYCLSTGHWLLELILQVRFVNYNEL